MSTSTPSQYQTGAKFQGSFQSQQYFTWLVKGDIQMEVEDERTGDAMVVIVYTGIYRKGTVISQKIKIYDNSFVINHEGYDLKLKVQNRSQHRIEGYYSLDNPQDEGLFYVQLVKTEEEEQKNREESNSNCLIQ